MKETARLQSSEVTTKDLTRKDLTRLKQAWKLTQSGMSGFDPQIEEGFELDYYSGHTLLTIQLRIGVLKKILRSERIPDEAERLLRELNWIEKDLMVIKEALGASITTPT